MLTPERALVGGVLLRRAVEDGRVLDVVERLLSPDFLFITAAVIRFGGEASRGGEVICAPPPVYILSVSLYGTCTAWCSGVQMAWPSGAR